MDKNNKVLIGAVLIILVALVSFNFNEITGKATKGKVTTLSVSPKVVTPGQRIYVSVVPGEKGVHEKANFYVAEDNLRKSSTNTVCGGSYRCYEPTTFSYVTSTSWKPGVYYVKVFDYGAEDFVKAEFTIIEK